MKHLLSDCQLPRATAPFLLPSSSILFIFLITPPFPSFLFLSVCYISVGELFLSFISFLHFSQKLTESFIIHLCFSILPAPPFISISISLAVDFTDVCFLYPSVSVLFICFHPSFTSLSLPLSVTESLISLRLPLFPSPCGLFLFRHNLRLLMEMFLISFADLLLHSQIKHSTKKVQEKPAIGRFFSLSWLQFLSFENLTAVDISNDFAAWQNVTRPLLK